MDQKELYPPQVSHDHTSNRHAYNIVPTEGKEYLVAVESLWIHWLSNFTTYGTIDPAVFFDEHHEVNPVTGKNRLPLFQHLSRL